MNKEVDFFDAHTEDKEPDLIQENQKLTHTSEPKPIKNGSLSKAEEIGMVHYNRLNFFTRIYILRLKCFLFHFSKNKLNALIFVDFI